MLNNNKQKSSGFLPSSLLLTKKRPMWQNWILRIFLGIGVGFFLLELASFLKVWQGITN